MYHCSLLNLVHATVSLTVKPFIIGDQLINIVVKKGQVIKYDIKYGGEPEPEVCWQNDSRELKEDKEERLYIFSNCNVYL